MINTHYFTLVKKKLVIVVLDNMNTLYRFQGRNHRLMKGFNNFILVNLKVSHLAPKGLNERLEGIIFYENIYFH